MEKIKTFMKNYKKIIIVGLVGLVLVAAASLLIQILTMKNEVTETNRRQLEKINDKYIEINEKLSYFMDETEKSTAMDLKTAYGVFSLEPEDVKDSDYFAQVAGNLVSTENLIILDGNRSLVNAAGNWRSINYKDAYYDTLFAGDEGVVTQICNQDTGTDYSQCMKCGSYYLLVQADETKVNGGIINSKVLWQMAKLSIGLDTNSYLAVVDQQDGTVIYQDSEELDIQSFDIETHRSDILSIDNGNYAAVYYDNDELGVRLFALTPGILISEKTISAMWLTIGVFIFALVILVAYIICLREDALDPEQEYKRFGKYFLKSQTSRFRALAIVTGIIAAIVFLLLINVNRSRYTLNYLENESDNCVALYELFNDRLNDVVELRDETMYGRGRIASYFLGKHTAYQTKQGISTLAKALDIAYLTVADSNGQTVLTSSSLDNLNFLADPENALYELRYALIGKEGVKTEGDEDTIGEDYMLFAVPRRGTDGIANGMMVICVKSGLSNAVYDNLDQKFHWLLEYDHEEEDKRVFWVDNYGMIISEKVVNSDEKVDENTLQDGYSGTLTIDGEEYLTAVRYSEVGQEYLYVITPVDWFSEYALLSTFCMILLYSLVALWIGYDGLGSKYHFEKRKRTLKDADDWKRTKLYWEELTIGKKMSKIILGCIYALSAILLLYWIFQGGLEGELLSRLLTSNWNQSVNGYSILLNLCIICLFVTGISIIEKLLLRIEKIVGDEGVTGCRLAISLVKYLGAVACAIMVVINFGVDAITALASVGIVGLAISFGAQELVKDMIAGMFLLFEGHFKVGDMLDVDGDWYWIKSIGVRTTKLEAWGSVKIVNNSNMTGMVNIQQASAVVNCDIWVDVRYDVDRIAEIMTEELPALKEQFSADVSTPVYKGIQEINAQRTLIRLRAYCPPLSQGYVGRALRYKVKQILDSHGILLANDCYNINVATMDSEQMKKEFEAYRQRMTGETES